MKTGTDGIPKNNGDDLPIGTGKPGRVQVFPGINVLPREMVEKRLDKGEGVRDDDVRIDAGQLDLLMEMVRLGVREATIKVGRITVNFAAGMPNKTRERPVLFAATTEEEGKLRLIKPKGGRLEELKMVLVEAIDRGIETVQKFDNRMAIIKEEARIIEEELRLLGIGMGCLKAGNIFNEDIGKTVGLKRIHADVRELDLNLLLEIPEGFPFYTVNDEKIEPKFRRLEGALWEILKQQKYLNKVNELNTGHRYWPPIIRFKEGKLKLHKAGARVLLNVNARYSTREG